MRPPLARQCLAGSQERNAHRPTGCGQFASHHEAIAAVVAGAAEHGDAPRGPPLDDLSRDGAPRGLHQLHAGDAGGDRQAMASWVCATVMSACGEIEPGFSIKRVFPIKRRCRR
jgi:hypothetical protein